MWIGRVFFFGLNFEANLKYFIFGVGADGFFARAVKLKIFLFCWGKKSAWFGLYINIDQSILHALRYQEVIVILIWS